MELLFQYQDHCHNFLYNILRAVALYGQAKVKNVACGRLMKDVELTRQTGKRKP